MTTTARRVTTAAGVYLLWRRVLAPLANAARHAAHAAVRVGLLPLLSARHVRLRRGTPYRGTHRVTGAPLRSFGDSLADLDRDMREET